MNIIEELKSVFGSTDADGVKELFEMLEAPDMIFDAMFPVLKITLAQQFEDPAMRELIKQGIKKDVEGVKLAYELLDKVKATTELSASKKEFFEMLLSVVTDGYTDATIYIQLLNDGATIPSYAHADDAGLDVYATEDMVIFPNVRGQIIKTGFAVAIPTGWQLSVRPRSGMSVKTSLRVGNAPGTIDAGYRDEVGIIIDNNSNEPVKISAGDRICQLVLEKVYTARFIVVEDIQTIGSNRGGGFGSTGK